MEAYAFIEWSNWFLVIIAAVTAWAVWIQARETKRAAETTKRSVEAIQEQTMTANRSYLAVGEPTARGRCASFPLWNYGSVAGHITKIEVEIIVQDFQGNETHRQIIESLADILVVPGEAHKGTCTLDVVLPDEARNGQVVISVIATYSTGFGMTDKLEFVRVYFPTEQEWKMGSFTTTVDFTQKKLEE